jgi:hypothetical protein
VIEGPSVRVVISEIEGEGVVLGEEEGEEFTGMLEGRLGMEGRWKVEGGRWRWKEEGGRRKEEERRRKEEEGRRRGEVGGRQRKEGGGRREGGRGRVHTAKSERGEMEDATMLSKLPVFTSIVAIPWPLSPVP